jgi:glycosyltransferase involved in cell wall biosynthesis
MPRLSIGLPVFNGERYLPTALDSLLGQAFGDFTLILLDNASTDGTRDICERYSRMDSRIDYRRHARNIGVVGNWYRTLELSSTAYFKWAADDDEYAPEFLERCIAVLDGDDTIACCYTRVQVIDEFGRHGRKLQVDIDTASTRPSVRFYNAIASDYLACQLYGVMRAPVLKQTTRYQGYVGEDRNFLAELCLRGRVYEIPDYLFLHRLYPKAWGAVVSAADVSIEDLHTYDPTVDWTANRRSGLRRVANYFAAIGRVPLPATERVRCCGQLFRVFAEKGASRLARPLRRTLSKGHE